MRYTLLVVAAAAALAAAGAAYSSLVAGGPSDDPFVAGGGRFGPGTFPGGFVLLNARDFSVDAHVEKKGHKVTGLFISGQNGISSSQTNVTCVSIDGNRAVVGGVDTTGIGRVRFLIDNGPPSSTIRDQSSATFTDPLDSPNWPMGFPYVCPAPNSGFNQEGYLDIHSGDIVISDGND